MTSVKERAEERAEKAEQREEREVKTEVRRKALEAEKLTRKPAVLEKRREREYFSQPELKVVLFPTLLSCCTGLSEEIRRLSVRPRG